VPQRPQTSRGLNVDAELTMVTTTASRSPIHPIVSLHKPPILQNCAMSLFEVKIKIQLFVKLALTTNLTHFNKRNAYKLNLKLLINALESSYCMHSNVRGDVWK
jgi:hypothetical protein